MNPVATAIGAASGLAATAPMTVFMRKAHRRLPQKERYPLPPRLITEKLTSPLQPEAPTVAVATLVSHFGYGAAMGALYGATLSPSRPGSWVRGELFGLAVWAGSYLGLLPALSIMKPVTKHPPKRTALMVGAHLVWGGFLGWLAENMLAGKPDERSRSDAI